MLDHDIANDTPGIKATVDKDRGGECHKTCDDKDTAERVAVRSLDNLFLGFHTTSFTPILETTANATAGRARKLLAVP